MSMIQSLPEVDFLVRSRITTRAPVYVEDYNETFYPGEFVSWPVMLNKVIDQLTSIPRKLDGNDYYAVVWSIGMFNGNYDISFHIEEDLMTVGVNRYKVLDSWYEGWEAPFHVYYEGRYNKRYEKMIKKLLNKK